MPQNDQTNQDSNRPNKKNDSSSHAGLWWILIAGGIFLVALLVLNIFLPNLTERVKFFTVNALSLLVVAIIAVQAYIYRRQWGAMERSLERTDKVIDKMQGQLEAMKEQ